MPHRGVLNIVFIEQKETLKSDAFTPGIEIVELPEIMAELDQEGEMLQRKGATSSSEFAINGQNNEKS